MHRKTMNMEHAMSEYTTNNWSHWIVTKGLKKYLESIPGKYSIDSLQKTAIPGT